ncbi:MAG TPA: quinoprotein dehydrogenase-associated putative ABC transporter substrate-binding protein [Vicinamibacterales bacterium]|nr:quinoprotein dehydrogenase-associated putative ABC transporter substrate-binding protein [Vicinamibacterales bacterium]
MSSVCRSIGAIAVAAAAVVWTGLEAGITVAGASGQPSSVAQPTSAAPPSSGADAGVLRVCSDPNNMPFSNDRQQGFENRIADLVARELGRHVEYFWAPQRRGFVRNTLRARQCDVMMGVPARYELARPTRPYYRSSYVFVSRRDRHLDIRSLDDPRLRRVQIGIQIVGSDYANPPAAQALAARKIVGNVHGYTVFGDYSQPDPQRAVVDAVATGEVDVAVVWGPLGGYYAARAAVPMAIAPVTPQQDGPALPFAFDISMAVRKDDAALHDALDAAIARRAADIRRILRAFDVPLLQRSDT